MANALVPVHDEEMFMPAMNIETAISRRNFVVDFVKKIMVQDKDFGVVPGTDKPTLLKPGAEKLITVFGYTPVFVPVTVTEDWTGDDHKGEPFFYYRYRCELHRTGNMIATSEGSCNSWEKKYRYRSAKRKCPDCGAEAIIKGKAEYGGGWVCFKKQGGCGAKFSDTDKRIADQEAGQVSNPDIADQVNTIQKMAQKRALVAAVLLAVNASEFFTQDIEDMVIEGEWKPAPEAEAIKPTFTPQQTPARRAPQPPADVEFMKPAPAPVDNPWDDLPEPPTDAEHAVISEWTKPQDALDWALMHGSCANEFEATNSLKKIVTEQFAGKLTKRNEQAVYLAFLRRQQEKLAAQPEPA